MKSATILGLMSGTSLDGLDLCLAHFKEVEGDYKYDVLKVDSIPYSHQWQDRLRNATLLSGEKLNQLSIELGSYFAKLSNNFILNSKLMPDYIASHGHTVFHQPEEGFTLQIANGPTLFAQTGVPVIYDFRSLDVAFGGQGAPLVPIGDMHLFGNYKACLNFGGIANISFQKAGERIAFDICPVNMALSDLTSEMGLPYDNKGAISEQGNMNAALLDQLNGLSFYKESGPKSLGLEWYDRHFKPLIKNQSIPLKDRLRTVVEHISVQVSTVLQRAEDGEVLVSGGGAYNDFLVSQLQLKTRHTIVVPSSEIIEFKEALIFAFLGWLRVNHQINTLKSVTGAERNTSSGVLLK